MKTRRVYSTPDIQSARTALGAARQAGIPDDDLSLVARHDIELDVIPEDRKDDHSDFMPAAVRGLAQGGATGLLAGLVALAIPPLGVTLAGAVAVGAAGAAVGAWSGALMGSAVPDPVRRKFEDEIEGGRILLVVDGDGEVGERADMAVVATGATPLPFEQPTALS
ncbi:MULTISPECIES: hypothetical protein [Luteibacter]|uniref:DUF1269 domain-containing protein n=1 Tax=Luteibacter flocculans TaxID=2780091 RepID=A0ABY4T2Y1_9GAMM|nr:MULTISPECIES: hypothetical protein [Luteibacter]URL58639.1 hypothetical protein IM816_00400 [Luteibacter flocculans]SFW68342.1 hypothetical protein SAMN02800691_2919 [Luteibacter sp. UNCMF366Tsu5.1]